MFENILVAIFFGVMQGLTEFLPVSSSGHLVILHEIFAFAQFSNQLAFDVALHLGTLFATISYFWRDLGKYLIAGARSVCTFFRRCSQQQDRHEVRDTDQRIVWLIVLAMIPAGLVGFIFDDFIESRLQSSAVVVVMLIVVSVIFVLTEWWQKKHDRIELPALSWPRALLIGAMQTLALIPGTSRSGITIAAGMWTRLTRASAARFSFLVAVPLIAGAGLKKGYDLFILGIPLAEIPVFVVGMVSAAIVGNLTIRFLLRFLQNRSLLVFAVYRVILAIIILVAL